MEQQKNIRSYTVSEVRQMMLQSDKVVIIDVRSPEEYVKQHIPDAVNIPIAQLGAHAEALRSATCVVTACGSGGNRCKTGAQELQQLGLEHAGYLEGGTIAWLEQ